MSFKQAFAAGGLMLLGVFGSTFALADSGTAIDVSARDSLNSFYALDPAHKELAAKAAGMLVFPRITKGGVGIAGEHGEGLLQIGGKTVGYYSITAASVGLTIGVAQRSEIVMFMTQVALDKFVQSKGWTVGAETGIAVVSKGAGGKYDSKTLQKPILGFVYGEKGLIGDLSLEGSKITKIDK